MANDGVVRNDKSDLEGSKIMSNDNTVNQYYMTLRSRESKRNSKCGKNIVQ